MLDKGNQKNHHGIKMSKSLFRLGPIIGYTDQTTSRILIETIDAQQVLCTWTNSKTNQIIKTQLQNLKRNKPHLFTCETLEPQTEYKIQFDIIKNNQILETRCGAVKTLNQKPDKIIVLSCNGNDIPENWKRVSQVQPDWVLHIGDQVYMDSVYFKFMLCIHFDEKEVEEEIRNNYAEYWNRQGISHVLSHFPNIMMPDDHDLCLDSSMVNNWCFSQKRHDTYLKIAKRIMHEYQTILVPSHMRFKKWDHSQYLSFGNEFGLLIVDFRTYYSKSCLFKQDQKDWIKSQLEPSQVKHLAIIAQNTIASFQHWKWSSKILPWMQMDNDYIELSQNRIKDVEWLLTELKKWKSKSPFRKLVWIAGDLHVFQQAEIYHKNEFLCPYYVSSPITSLPLTNIMYWITAWIPTTYGFTEYGPFHLKMLRQRYQNNFVVLHSSNLKVCTHFF